MASKKAPCSSQTHPPNTTMLSTISELDGSGEGFLSESYHQPEDVVYVGSDDECYETSSQRTERCRAKFDAYLRCGGQRPPLIMSASLKGPFDSKSWENPWHSQIQQAVTTQSTEQTNSKARGEANRKHLPTSKRITTLAAESTSLGKRTDINLAPKETTRTKKAQASSSQRPQVNLFSGTPTKTHVPTLLPVTDSDALPNPFNPTRHSNQTAARWLRRPGLSKKPKPGLTEHDKASPSSPSEQAATNRKRVSDSRSSLTEANKVAADGVSGNPTTCPVLSHDKPPLFMSSGIRIEDSNMLDEPHLICTANIPLRDLRSLDSGRDPVQQIGASKQTPWEAYAICSSVSPSERLKTSDAEPAYPSPRPAMHSSGSFSSLDSSNCFATQQDESFYFKTKTRQLNRIDNKGEQSVAQIHITEASSTLGAVMDNEGVEDEAAAVQQTSHKIRDSADHNEQHQLQNATPEPENRDILEINCGAVHINNETKKADKDVPLYFSDVKASFDTPNQIAAEPHSGNGNLIAPRLSEIELVYATYPLEADQTLLSSQLQALQSPFNRKYSFRKPKGSTPGVFLVESLQNSQKGDIKPSANAETIFNQESESTTSFEADETTLVQVPGHGVPGVYSHYKVDRITDFSPAVSQQSLGLMEAERGICDYDGFDQSAAMRSSTQLQPISFNNFTIWRTARSGPVSSSQDMCLTSGGSKSRVSGKRIPKSTSQPVNNYMTSPLSPLRSIAKSSFAMSLGAVPGHTVTSPSLPDQELRRKCAQETSVRVLAPEKLSRSPTWSSRSAISSIRQATITSGSKHESGDDGDINAEDGPIHDVIETRDPVAGQKTPRLAIDAVEAPKLATQEQSPWAYPEDGYLRTSCHVDENNVSMFLSQNIRSSPPLPRIPSFSKRRAGAQRSPTPAMQSPWAVEDMATPNVKPGQAIVSPLSLIHYTDSREVPNPVLPSFTDAQKSQESDKSNPQPNAASTTCRPSTPVDKLSSLPTPELTFSLKPFRRFLSPSPRIERQKSRPTPNRASCTTQDTLSLNPWAQESRLVKQVRWAPLPGSVDLIGEGDEPFVTARSPSVSEGNDGGPGSSSSDVAVDNDDEDYIEEGLSRSARSRNVIRAKKTAAAVLAFSVQRSPISTRPYSPPPPIRTLVDDLPSEVKLFQNHFAKVDSERKFFRPKTLNRRIADDKDQLEQFAGGGSQPVDAVARRFAEADAVSMRSSAKKPRISILSKPASSTRYDDQNEENEQPMDDVSAVIDNLGDFLGGWDVDVELTHSARGRESRLKRKATT